MTDQSNLRCSNCWVDEFDGGYIGIYLVTAPIGTTYTTLCEECFEEWRNCGATLEQVFIERRKT